MKINLKKMLVILIIISYFVPEGMSTVGADDKLLKATFLGASSITLFIKMLYWGRNLAGITLTLLYIFNKIANLIKKKIRLEPIDYFIIFGLWVLYSSSKNQIALYDLFIVLSVCVGALCLTKKMCIYNQNFYVDTIYYVVGTILLINLMLGVLYPEGITIGTDYLSTPYYFVGNKNQATPLLILGLFILNIKRNINANNRLFRVLIVFANALIMGSSTGILCVFIFSVLNFLHNKKKVASITSIKRVRKMIYIALGLMIEIVFFNIQKIFSFVIVGMFNKDLTFSGRTFLWKEALEQFFLKPIIGYGYGHTVQAGLYAHNLILELLVTTGLVGFIIYFAFIIKVYFKKLKDNKGKFTIVFIETFVVLVYANMVESFAYNISELFLLGLILYISNVQMQGVRGYSYEENRNNNIVGIR